VYFWQKHLKYFDTKDLHPAFKDVGERYKSLARDIVFGVQGHPEKDLALRKLLESRDAVFRCMVYQNLENKNLNKDQKLKTKKELKCQQK